MHEYIKRSFQIIFTFAMTSCNIGHNRYLEIRTAYRKITLNKCSYNVKMLVSIGATYVAVHLKALGLCLN